MEASTVPVAAAKHDARGPRVFVGCGSDRWVDADGQGVIIPCRPERPGRGDGRGSLVDPERFGRHQVTDEISRCIPSTVEAMDRETRSRAH